MRATMILALCVAFFAIGCASPEARRTRGGGPGADVGNRTQVVQMHEGSVPYYKTPQIIAAQPAPLDTAQHARTTNRR